MSNATLARFFARVGKYLGVIGCIALGLTLTGCQAPAIITSPTQPLESITAEPMATATLAPQSGVLPTEIPVRSLPLLWSLLSDDFEGGNLSKWNQISTANLSTAPGMGVDESIGLEVKVHKRETYLYRTDAMKTTEGYVTFWFNPNHVAIENPPDVPVQGKSIRIVDIKGLANYSLIAGLRIWEPKSSSGEYKAVLEWGDADGSHFDLDSGQFTLKDGWQKITLGFKINDWVAVWVDDQLMREVTPVHHADAFGEIVELGKTNDDSVVVPGGSMLYDDFVLQIPRIPDLWVDASGGNDQNNGLEVGQAFRSIQKAAGLAGPGTTVHILPGIYRESIHPVLDGTESEPTVYVAEKGPGTVFIRGSVSSKTLGWKQMDTDSIGLPQGVSPARIYFADLSAWKLEGTPRFVAEVDDQGKVVSRLPLAREPDWQVSTDWKQQEYWWSADGGAYQAGCDPSSNTNRNCDQYSRSLTRLNDKTSDSSPADVDPGNLTTLGDLRGATLVAIDTVEGHYVYRRTIVGHDIGAGTITVDRKCEFDEGSGEPGLGWGTKYYVEDKPNLLDSPGEWWYDSATGLLYLWPSIDKNPGEINLEISVLDNGFDLSHRSNIHLDGLTLQLFNGNAITDANELGEQSHNNAVRNVKLEYANQGIVLFQNTDEDQEQVIRNFTLEGSEIAFMDTDAINMTYTWPRDSVPETFIFAGITDTLIRSNELHDLGFRSDSDSSRGVLIQHANQVQFMGNHVYNVAHNGVQFSYAVDQAAKEYGFLPAEIKTGAVLVRDNLFERTCQLTTDCGGLKFWGDPPHSHVYRDVLVTGNTFRNIIGWTSIAEKRGLWSGGPSSQVQGMGGFGLYVDMASGIQVFRNEAYHNGYADFLTYGVWRDGLMLFYNNVAVDSLFGFSFGGLEFDTHGNVDTEVANNIIINNEQSGIWLTTGGQKDDGLAIDHNLYFQNGWSAGGSSQTPASSPLVLQTARQTSPFSTLAEVNANTPWDASSVEGNPGFRSFEFLPHDFTATSMPDFHLTNGSIAIDQGTSELPGSLADLLVKYGLQDPRTGAAYDIGRFEVGATTTSTGNMFHSILDATDLPDFLRLLAGF